MSEKGGKGYVALLSIPEAAARLGVHPNSVRRWYKSGRLMGWRIGPKVIRFRLDDIEKFIAQGAGK